MERESGYRAFEHTADVGIEVWAPSAEEVIEIAGGALFEVMGEAPPVGAVQRTEIRVEGVDLGDLLVRSLTELLVLFELRSLWPQGLRCHAIDRLGDDGLAVAIEVTAAAVDRHADLGLAEVKAVTYHQLVFEERPGKGYMARVVFDL